jgi:hypothetical protein
MNHHHLAHESHVPQRLLLLLLGAVALAGVGYVGLAQSHPSKRVHKSEVAPASDLSELERRLSAVERKADEPTHYVVVNDPAAASVQAPAAPNPSSAPARPAPSPAALDNLIDTEPRDPGWSRNYEHTLTEAFSTTFPGEKIQQVSCATSACRLVVEHSSVDGERQFNNRFWTAMPPYDAIHYEPHKEGDVSSTVLQIIRKGYGAGLAGLQ